MLHRPARRSLLLLALPALFVSLFAVAAATGATATKPPVAERPAHPPKADRDGDKVFEDLEARLASMSPNDRLSVIVSLTSPASAARVADTSRRVGGLDVSRRFSIVDAFAATVTKGQAEALTHVPWVAHVEENSRVRAFDETARASFGVTKARVDAPGLDGDADGDPNGYSRGDLVAAVIDTGIDAGHLDLDEGKVLAFKDFVNGRTTAYDDNGHGTHVAATIAGDGDARADRLYHGVAPGAGLVGVKVLDAAGGGTMENVTAAIEWVVQNKDVYGIEAINLSLGTSGCSNGTDATSVAANNAHGAGLVVAVAAGNEGPGTCTIGTPGAAASALTVGAMADTGAGGFSLADFSSRGRTLDGRVKPDIAAPGVDITSAQTGTTNGYVVYSGTSMATPFVAGVALLARDANAALTPQQVKDKLTATAIDWGRIGADGEYGAGRLDAYAALASAGAPLTTGPATPKHELREGTLGGTGSYVDYPLDIGDLAHPIAATLIIPAISGAYAYNPDFDLYLYGPSGALVASAETVYRQENVSFKPTAAGRYTLRVRSYSGSGAYYVDISGGLAVDTTAPTVTAISPADAATGVPVATTVSATFSEAMNAAATQSALTLVRASDGAPVSGTFAWSGTRVTFDPASDLLPSTQYRATVGTAASDTAGNKLAAAKTWTFTTGAALAAVTAFPVSAPILTGSLRAGDATRLRSDDGVFYEVNSNTASTFVSAWYGRFTNIPRTLKSLKITYSGKASRACTQTISVYRFTDGAWVQVDSRAAGATETAVVDLAVGGTLSSYVGGPSGSDLYVRIRCTTTAGTFFTSGDLLKIDYTK